MDLRTVVTISALLLMTAAALVKQSESAPTVATEPTETNSTTTRATTVCSCPGDTQEATTAIHPTPIKPIPVQGFLTVRWKSPCAGDVILYQPSFPSSQHPSEYVCWTSEAKNFLKNVCEKKDCKGPTKWHKGAIMAQSAYNISKYGAQLTTCNTLRVNCTVKPNVEGQLHAYKVVTALLSCVLLVILLIRFARPTVEALQRRFSDRRQNRWVGPTQSHSVSYHRGKTVKNEDREKRLSYPALERLAVSDSREPSSNRNSGCNY